MPDYRLTNAAFADLSEIAQYGDEKFGVKQSNRYRDRLKQRFELLAEKPFLYPAVDHIRPGYRRCVCGSHSIYYQVASTGVEIIRVLGRQDVGESI